VKLITGAGGFIGRHAARLASEPFRALLHRPDPSFEREFPLAEVFVGDLLDRELMASALAGVDGVLHFAAKNIDHDGSGFERVNVDGLNALLDLLPPRRRVVALSSTGVYGHHRHAGVDETTAINPDTPLSRSKAAADAMLVAAHETGRVEATVLRHRFVYGAGDQHIVPGLHRSASKSPVWVGGGKARLSMVWATDLARVAWRMVGEPEPRDRDPVYHVTDGSPVSFRQLVTELCARYGGSPPRASIPFGIMHGALRARERLRGLDPEVAPGITSLRVALVGQDNWFSTERLSSRLPDFAPTPLLKGLDASADWYTSVL
jgi:2-alkyl-3-oxoalkanoate reductase